jgi:hypothetical protein
LNKPANPKSAPIATREFIQSLQDPDIFDDYVSFPVDNGDGTTTFSFRCNQDQFTVDQSKIISLDQVGICGNGGLYRLKFSY